MEKLVLALIDKGYDVKFFREYNNVLVIRVTKFSNGKLYNVQTEYERFVYAPLKNAMQYIERELEVVAYEL